MESASDTLDLRNNVTIDVDTYKSEREKALSAVRALSPWLDPEDSHVSNLIGGAEEAKRHLSNIRPTSYGRTRNHLEGDVTQLSPYISRGVLDSQTVSDVALEKDGPKHAEKFIQQVAWREYWQGILAHNPQWLWEDAESYKTGFTVEDYSDALPDDIARAETGVACIDDFLRRLITNGWVHNHARLYLAGYICHWRHVKWQTGARFFLNHLLDADPASNNLSWQWVASTFSHKPYYFNLENVRKFSGSDVDTSAKNNEVLNASYEILAKQLFPNLESP